MVKSLAVFLLALAGSTCFFTAPAQNTFPLNDIADPREGCYAFTNATIIRNAQSAAQNATMVIRKGKIVSIGSAGALPPDAVVIDCKGKYIYPSFIDMYSDYGIPPIKNDAVRQGRSLQSGSNTRGAYGWNEVIRSEVDAARIFAVEAARAKELRSLGIGTVLTHQQDGISRGTGVLVTLADEKENNVIVKERASAQYSFDKGSSTQDYPTSLMGAIALLRQNFLDADWYRSRPATEGTNLSLQAFNDNRTLPQVFESADKWNDLRADKLGDEFGVQYIIKGSGNEYQRVAEIKATHANFILPLDFPLPMDLSDPTDARYVSLADLEHWEMAPANAGFLEKAGIVFALTATGLKDENAFFGNIRKAIAAGLGEGRALEALTSTPAKLLGISDITGSLDAGKMANFLITSGPVFQEKTVLFQNWIQGSRYDVRGENWQDARGTYSFELGTAQYRLDVKGELLKPTAVLVSNAADSSLVDLSITDRLVKLSIHQKKDSSASILLTGVVTGNGWRGTGQLADGKWVQWSATKNGDLAIADSAKKGKDSVAEIGGTVRYPFDGYGFTELPKPSPVLFRNATVWTNEAAGILTHTDVLVKNGKIAAIGNGLSDPAATIVDATGKHLTAGIIDEHSHIAATGGINECSQSVTAEVRVADVLDPEDIDIYRQLSGGVTSSHILHGSCNTIGGQTQLIKLRWGANAEQLKFAHADPFIKFALGENVKRSYSPVNGRFPDTRMGVEEVLTDAFTRARDYQRMPAGKRRDLELDALVEILEKKRFITCHSYIQSEINALIKIADRFHFTVNTFTHILEGYKVADKLKAHGAAASTFSDWWAYKVEVTDAIPQNAYIMQQVGLNVAINSDDPEMARRLNQEAAKSVKYAGMDEQGALKMVTLNPAIMLHVADRTGSIRVGKDADLVLWTDHPLSIYAKAEKTMVDGIVYFDAERDRQLREVIASERIRLVQKMINGKKSGEKTTPARASFRQRNYCEEDHVGGNLLDRIEEAARNSGGEETK